MHALIIPCLFTFIVGLIVGYILGRDATPADYPMDDIMDE